MQSNKRTNQTQPKSQKPFRRGRWFPGRDKPKTVGTRRELAALIFDMLLDDVPQDEAEQRIHREAKSPVEAMNAITRYRLASGCTGRGVSL